MDIKVLKLDSFREDITAPIKETKESKQISKAVDSIEGKERLVDISTILKEKLKESRNGYYYNSNDEWIQISNFIIEPLEEILSDSKSIIKVKLKTKHHEDFIELDLKSFSKVSSFQHLINQKGLDYWFFGNQEALNLIRTTFLQKKYNRVIGYEHIGFEYSSKENVFFISQEAVLNSDGNVDPSKRFIGHQPLKTNLASENPISSNELSELLNNLFGFNDLRVSVPVIAFSLSCFLKEKLRTIDIPFNHLYITGEAGAGKTQTVNAVMKKIFGMTDEFNASQITSAAINLNASRSNMLPFIIDEYKPGAMMKKQFDLISGLLRNSYNGTPAIKSSIRGMLIIEKPSTPIVLVGEMPIKESANQERAIQIYLSKKTTCAESNIIAFKELKENSDLLSKLGRSCLNHVLRDDFNDIVKIKSFWEAKLESDVPSRVKNSISNLMLGLHLLKSVCLNLDVDLEMITGLDLESMFKAILDSINESADEGSIVEKTLVIINEIAEAGHIKRGQHFQLEKSGLLAIRMIEVYPKIKPYLRSQCVSHFELLERKEFEKQAKLMGLGSPNLQHRFIGKLGNQKVFKFDVEALSHLKLDALLI